MKFDVQAALDEILTESIAPAISANPAIPPPKLASIARIAVKEVETQDIEFDTKARPDDHEAYAEALRFHGAMSYGQAMRVLGWGGTRAGQAEDFLRLASRVEFNEQGWACLSGIKPHPPRCAGWQKSCPFDRL